MPLAPTESLPLGARHELLLELHLSRSLVRLELHGARTPLLLHVETRPAGMPFGAPPGMPLSRFRAQALAALRRSFREDAQGRALDGVRLSAALRRAECQLEANRDGQAWSVARRFAPSLRWAVYEVLAADGSRRLLQLTRAAPGALSFALTHAALADATGRGAALAFRDAVLAGHSLRRALRPLLEDWAAFGARAPMRGAGRQLAPFAAAPEPERRARLGHQRILLRRALAGVDGRLLWLPPPLAFAPEDIPRTLRAQQHWFRTVKGRPEFLHAAPGVPPAVQVAFVQWLSAHAHEPLRERTLRGLFHLVCERGAVVPRALGAEALQSRAADWEQQLWEEQGGPEMLREAEEELRGDPLGLEAEWVLGEDDWGDTPATMPMPWPDRVEQLAAAHPACAFRAADGSWDLSLPHPFGPCEQPMLRVVPLTTASALRQEARLMQHCVARYVGAALHGEAFFFHAEAAGMPLTVHVRGPAAQARLELFLGHRNRPPGPEQTALVHAWWNDLARAHGLDPALHLPAPGTPAPPFDQECPY